MPLRAWRGGAGDRCVPVQRIAIHGYHRHRSEGVSKTTLGERVLVHLGGLMHVLLKQLTPTVLPAEWLGFRLTTQNPIQISAPHRRCENAHCTLPLLQPFRRESSREWDRTQP